MKKIRFLRCSGYQQTVHGGGVATYYIRCYRQHHVISPSLSSSGNLLTCKVAADNRDNPTVCADCCVEELNTDCSVCLAWNVFIHFLCSFIFSFSFSFSRVTFLPLLSLFISLFRFFFILSCFVSFIFFAHFMHPVIVFFKYCSVFSVASFFISSFSIYFSSFFSHNHFHK